MVVRVLLAEDDADLREMGSYALTRGGYEVTVAVDGADAVDKAAAGGYAAIVLDVHMPKLSGVDVVRALRARPDLGRTPILMLTGATGDAATEAAFAAGADEYLTKPYALRELLNRVAALIERPRA